MDYNYNIVFDGSEKIKAIRIYREMTGVGLKEAKEIIDTTPGAIFENLTLDKANDIADRFLAENCQVSVHISSKKAFSDTLSSIIPITDAEVDISCVTDNNLIAALRQTKKLLLSAEQLQNELETAEKAVKKVKSEFEDMKNRFGFITFIGAVIGFIVGIIILSYIGSIIGFIVGAFIGSIINTKKNDAKYEAQAQKYYDENYPKVETKKNEIIEIAKTFFTSQAFCEAQELIPSDYFDTGSIDYLIKLVENRRADTLKEAINLYEDYLHKNCIEEIQRQQLVAAQESANAQKEASKALKQQAVFAGQIAKNTKSTARATKLNTFINIIKK